MLDRTLENQEGFISGPEMGDLYESYYLLALLTDGKIIEIEDSPIIMLIFISTG